MLHLFQGFCCALAGLVGTLFCNLLQKFGVRRELYDALADGGNLVHDVGLLACLLLPSFRSDDWEMEDIGIK